MEINGTDYDFAPIFLAGSFASVTGSINRSNLPAISAYEKTGAQVLTGDILNILTDPLTISSSGGSYAINEEDEVFGESNGSASVVYTNPSITNADDSSLVVFNSVSGTITFTSYGSSLESYISGTFEATVTGSREVVANPEEDEIDDSREGLSGTISGSFGITLGTSTEVSSVVE